MPDPAPLPPIVVRDLAVAFRGREVFADLDLVAQPGRRIGLIGENGSGKSTLLRAIAGRLPSRARLTGTTSAPADLAWLGQEPPFEDGHTVAQVLEATLQPLRRAVAEVERLADAVHDPAGETAYAEALDAANTIGAWDADRRAEEAAHRLGVGGLAAERLVGTLSGGERTRLALATLMALRPRAVLLDEPTNHLDDDAIELLAQFLSDLPGVVLLASHDRVFLDQVCTDLFDLDPSRLGTDGQGGRRFGGGWSAYEEHRAATRRRWQEAYDAEQDRLVRLRAATRIDNAAIAHDRAPRDNDKYIYGFKGANVDRALARRKKDAQRRLAHAERVQLPKPPTPLSFGAPLTSAGHGGVVVRLREVVVPGRLRVDRLDVGVGEHLLVSGPNGSGKSTLLGVIAGRLRAESGSVTVSARRVAELAQDTMFAEPGRSAEQTYRMSVGPTAAAQLPLRALGLLRPSDVRKPVGLLSVGQRRRLALALTVAARPDLLLMDEPTNHLSLALVDEIEEALQHSVGTVVVATHDRWLRRRWDGAVLAL